MTEPANRPIVVFVAATAEEPTQQDRRSSMTTNPRPFSELSETGLLWLINRTVFHSRGLALALHVEDGAVLGWSLEGDGSEAWTYPEDVDQQGFQRSQETLSLARELAGGAG